jgi:hypothetical protein
MRNTPEALACIERAAADGVRAAVAGRDAAFGDYSQAPAELRPDPANVIDPERGPRGAVAVGGHGVTSRRGWVAPLACDTVSQGRSAGAGRTACL